jgi:hypothetical protein
MFWGIILYLYKIGEPQMICQNEKCKKEHLGTYGAGKFCCLSCSKVRKPKYTEQWKKKLSESVKNSEIFKKNNCEAIKRKGLKRVIFVCKYCKKEFYRMPSNIHSYCSRQCYINGAKNENKTRGGYRKGSGRSKHTWYESTIAGRVYLDSSYELAYAKWLDKNEIDWRKNTKRFPYIDLNNKNRYYIPDFRLVEFDEYIEVKGYKRENDEIKWKNFPYKLTILMKEQLQEMKIL